jgi:hypothetical protein
MSEGSNSVLVKRPPGIWILTLSVGVFAGVIPFAGVLLFFFEPTARQAFNMGLYQIFSSIILASGVLYACYGVWQGNAKAKRILIWLVAIHWGYIIFNNVQWIFSDELMMAIPEEQRYRPFANIVRSALWIFATFWYLLMSKKSKSFFAARAAD